MSFFLLLEPEARRPFEQLQENSQTTVRMKLKALFPALPPEPIVVLLDNFQDLVDQETRRVRDHELVDGVLVTSEILS